jgi:hypothetical protein
MTQNTFFRKCNNCERWFTTDNGLKQHQGFSKNPGCYRIAFKKAQKKVKNIQDKYKNLHHYIPLHPPPFQDPKNKGDIYDQSLKQVCMNVMNWWMTKNVMTPQEALKLTSEVTGVPVHAIRKFCREFETFGELVTRVKSQFNRQDSYEKLTHEQLYGIRLKVHDEFRLFMAGSPDCPEVPTLKSIQKRLIQDPSLPKTLCRETVRRILRRYHK